MSQSGKKVDPSELKSALEELISPHWAPSGVHVATPHSQSLLETLLPASRHAESRATIGAAEGAFTSLLAVLKEPLALTEPVGQIAIRILRNLCVRSPENQARAASVEAHVVVLKQLDAVFKESAVRAASQSQSVGEAGELKPSLLYTPYYGFAVEFLVNFVTGNQTNASTVWPFSSPRLFSQLLSCDNKAAAAATAALMHNCIIVLPHLTEDIVTPFTDDGGTSTSLLNVMVSLMNDNYEESEKEEERFMWSFNIIRRLIRASMLRQCFEVLGPKLDEISASPEVKFSKSQLLFLMILEAGASKSAETAVEHEIEIFEVPEGSLSFFGELLDTAMFERRGDLLRIVASIIGSVVIINDNSAALDDLRCQTVRLAVASLRSVAAHENGELQSSHAANDVQDLASVVDDIVGLKGLMVRAIAVCCDLCAKAQDLVRDLHGIPLVLNALAYEKDADANPFLREWAIFAVRNLTAGNDANAKEIAGYEFVGVQSDNEFLEKAGLEAFVDPETGRPRLRQRASVP